VVGIAEDPETVDLYIRTVGAGVALNVSIERGQHEGFKFKFESSTSPFWKQAKNGS
jgi:hypothetical protein